MSDARAFAADVFRTVGGHLAGKAADLAQLAAADASFDGWLEAEAYLACREAEGRFSEVELRPTYASEGVAGTDRGGLRVGGIGGPGHHLWLFAEFVWLAGDRRIDHAVARLLRLGWKRSAAVVFVVGRDEVNVGRPPLTAAVRIALPGGGAVVVQAFDVKRDPADTLTVPTRHE